MNRHWFSSPFCMAYVGFLETAKTDKSWSLSTRHLQSNWVKVKKTKGCVCTVMRAKTELVAVVRRMGRIRSAMRYKMRRKKSQTGSLFTRSYRSIKVKETKKAKMASLNFKIYQNMSTILKSIQNVSPNKHQSSSASWHFLAWPSLQPHLHVK